MTQLLALSTVALMGFAIQRGTICTVLAVQQLLDHGRWQRLAGLLLAGAVAALVMGSWALGQGAAPNPPGWAAGWETVAGGVLFGIGATLNDGCTLGTIAKLARGQIGFAAVVPGFVVGAWIGAEARGAWGTGGPGEGRSGRTSPGRTSCAIETELNGATKHATNRLATMGWVRATARTVDLVRPRRARAARPGPAEAGRSNGS